MTAINQFAVVAAGGGNPAVTSTAACRRKRDIMPFLLETIDPTSNINQYEYYLNLVFRKF